jgi:hypothetical protein
MNNLLSSARELASAIRYAGDISETNVEFHSDTFMQARSAFAQSGLLIDSSVTPALANVLDQVCESLNIPSTAVEGYVYCSAEPQAACVASGQDSCIVSFSSGMVDLLSEEELKFVFGHELGHFLLNHMSPHDSNASPAAFMLQRAQEISADRIGLIACGSLNAASRAAMKTLSGLTDKQLRFDISQFISQMEEFQHQTAGFGHQLTHPSLVIRCRSLVLFSNAGLSDLTTSFQRPNSLSRIDTQIEHDLATYVDGPLRLKIKEAREQLAFWSAVQMAIEDGVLDKGEQRSLREQFDEKLVEKMLLVVQELSWPEVSAFVQAKVANSISSIEELFGHDAQTELAKVVKLHIN